MRPKHLTHTTSVSQERFQNYLRTFRRKYGLSQAEIARLLGLSSASKVSRHEGFVQRPSVKAMFAYEVIFGAHVSELFAGDYDKTRADVQNRAKELADSIERESAGLRDSRKLELLRSIVDFKPRPTPKS